MTAEQKRILVKMRNEKASINQIADALNTSRNIITTYCQNDQIVCRQCGEPLQHLPGKRKKSFCSNKCRLSWWNDVYYVARKVGSEDDET